VCSSDLVAWNLSGIFFGSHVLDRWYEIDGSWQGCHPQPDQHDLYPHSGGGVFERTLHLAPWGGGGLGPRGYHDGDIADDVR